MKTGYKSITAQRQRAIDKRRKKKSLKPKPELDIKIQFNFNPFCNQLKKAVEMIKNAFEHFETILNNVFPKPAIQNTWLQLQMADNNRPNRFLVGWGRLNEGV